MVTLNMIPRKQRVMVLMRSRKVKRVISPMTNRLKPSEIESLKKEMQQSAAEMDKMLGL